MLARPACVLSLVSSASDYSNALEFEAFAQITNEGTE